MSGTERSRRYRERYPGRVKESQKKYNEQFLAIRRERERKWRKDHPYQWHTICLKTRYGIDRRGLEELVLRSEGRCKLCEKITADLVLDHDHRTNVVRGLLCRGCNAAIGMLRDDPEMLLRAIRYLEAD